MSGRTDGTRCATCGDVADQATVIAVRGPDAEVALEDGTRSTVAVDLIPGVVPGVILLVHQGVAIGTVRDPQRAVDRRPEEMR